MAISDSIPERRNLILTSLAFILFYAGGGESADDSVKLIFVNVVFSKPNILAYFSWGILIWFCIRFWQKSGFKFWSSITKEIISSKISKSLANYASNKAKKQLKGSQIADHSTKNVKAEHWKYKYYYVYILCNFESTPGTNTHQEMVKIGGLKGFLFTTNKIILHTIKDNAFSEELVPYILFFLAVTSPHWGQLL